MARSAFHRALTQYNECTTPRRTRIRSGVVYAHRESSLVDVMDSSRKLAQQLLEYFTRSFAKYGHAEFADGAACAREWLSLIDHDSLPTERLDALLDRVAARSDGGSAWLELQLGVRAWARKQRHAM